MTRLGVAVIGAGVGLEHVAAYRKLPDLYEVVALVDPAPERRALAAKLFPVPVVDGTLDTVLDRADVDVVDLCTPPHLHLEMIRAALEAGKHVVCEKPLVGSLAECDAVAGIVERSRGRLMPIFQYRFGRGLQKLLHLRAAGLTGRCFLSTIETAWNRGADYYAVAWRGRWKTERGGALLSHAIHNHDLLCHVVGPVRSVFARTATRVNPIETEDCASAALEMADGSLASLSVTLGSRVEISRLRFCFESLTAESSLDPYRPGTEPWRFDAADDATARRIDEALAGFEPEPQGYAGQLARFHRALADHGELPVTLGDARASLELVTAMYGSARTGEAISLPLDATSPGYESWLPPEERPT
jgi:predicted dehydrogenase